MGTKKIKIKNPVIFDPKIKKMDYIKLQYKVNEIFDTYTEQLEDLFLVRNPKYKFNKNYKKDFKKFIKEHSKNNSLQNCGKWVYFPWNKFLVHYLDDKLHQEIRTARNKNLISKEEQEKFYNTKIGIAGLSVGSHATIAITLMGGGKTIKLADPDTISPSNLNRMPFDFTQVGVNKAEALAHYIYQLNPYADIRIYKQGITEKNLKDFIDGLDIIIEELDDIEMKVKIRKKAKSEKIPVIMATDNGDGVIVDIERFDLNPKMPIFHGNLKGFNIKKIKSDPKKMYEAMAKIIDISLVPQGVLDSVLEVGKTIYSWPQLASAATISGGIVSYVARKIALGKNINNGKTDINIDLLLDPNYIKNKNLRKKKLKYFLKITGIDM